MSHIEWNRVTWYSQIAAVALGLLIFVLGFYVGMRWERHQAPQPASATSVPADEKILADVTYSCDAGKTIHAIYREEQVELLLSDGRHFSIAQAVSGSGVRYANKDESFVFWNKSKTAFVEEGDATTFADCNEMPQPQ